MAAKSLITFPNYFQVTSQIQVVLISLFGLSLSESEISHELIQKSKLHHGSQDEIHGSTFRRTNLKQKMQTIDEKYPTDEYLPAGDKYLTLLHLHRLVWLPAPVHWSWPPDELGPSVTQHLTSDCGATTDASGGRSVI